jgi:hypothetical protein
MDPGDRCCGEGALDDGGGEVTGTMTRVTDTLLMVTVTISVHLSGAEIAQSAFKPIKRRMRLIFLLLPSYTLNAQARSLRTKPLALFRKYSIPGSGRCFHIVGAAIQRNS